MEEILHQLRLVVYPHYFYRFSHHPKRWLALGCSQPSTGPIRWRLRPPWRNFDPASRIWPVMASQCLSASVFWSRLLGVLCQISRSELSKGGQLSKEVDDEASYFGMFQLVVKVAWFTIPRNPL